MHKQFSPKRVERASGAVRQAYERAGANLIIESLRSMLVADLRAARLRRDQRRARELEQDLNRLRGIELTN